MKPQFKAQPRNPWPDNLLSAVAEYLHLSWDETGYTSQTEMLNLAIEAALDCIETDLDMVLLEREFTAEGEFQMPVELPFDSRTAMRLKNFTFDAQVMPVKIQQEDGRYLLSIPGQQIGHCEINILLGQANWNEIDGALRYAAIALAARAYEFRDQPILVNMDIGNMLEPYRKKRLGFNRAVKS